MPSKRIESFDFSKKAQEILAWRNARRNQLREEYLRQTLHPVKQDLVMDSGIKRFALMRLTHEIRANLTGKSMMISLGTVFGIIFIFTCIAKNIKTKLEHKYRTGQVSYADRESKFG
ncbi:NADH dehydrogenase (ubiquinone) B15 subunit [Ptiloglossa arizonensis]|uniref:NADH dehydrogenase (ubiquinone) B15 subunit n=1 Tax=Ptiloglossa arizonensis TaxID=3350558 RepID=UPI003FA1779E